MEQILDAVSYGLLIIVSLVAFSALLRFVIPLIFLRVKYSVGRSLGRGLKTYKYPTGRAVLYEPHPTIRKYINKYLLFVHEGYKYFKCTVDEGIKSLDFELIMFNNKNKIVDVINVCADIDASATSSEILLHPDTSYVAINLKEANGFDVKRLTRSYYTIFQIIVYFLLVFGLAFVEINAVSDLAIELFKAALERDSIAIATGSLYLMSSFAIAAMAVFIVIMSGRKKGIEVVLYGKK